MSRFDTIDAERAVVDLNNHLRLLDVHLEKMRSVDIRGLPGTERKRIIRALDAFSSRSALFAKQAGETFRLQKALT